MTKYGYSSRINLVSLEYKNVELLLSAKGSWKNHNFISSLSLKIPK